MVDKAHEFTDQKLEQMERHLSAIYSRASKEIQETADEYFRRFKILDEKKRKLVESGELDSEEYKTWRKNKMLYGKRYAEMKEQVAKQLLNVNKTAQAYTNGELPEVYALNYNQLDGKIAGYSFTLTDADTVANLAKHDKTLLPYKYVDGKKDVRWNTKKVNAEINGLKEVQKENSRLDKQEEYIRNKRKAEEDVQKAATRSGVEYREQEQEAREKLEDLETDWNKVLRDWSVEDRIKSLENLRGGEINE